MTALPTSNIYFLFYFCANCYGNNKVIELFVISRRYFFRFPPLSFHHLQCTNVPTKCWIQSIPNDSIPNEKPLSPTKYPEIESRENGANIILSVNWIFLLHFQFFHNNDFFFLLSVLPGKAFSTLRRRKSKYMPKFLFNSLEKIPEIVFKMTQILIRK